MTKTGVFYGSTTGNSQAAAEEIGRQLVNADLFDISSTNVEKMLEYDLLILGSSTWGYGDIQEDWEVVLESLGKLDLGGKKVAFFGSGDSATYSDTFCNAMGILFDTLKNSNAEFIGKCSTDSYEFVESDAVRDGMFVGLALDEDNEGGLTTERIEKWTAALMSELDE